MAASLTKIEEIALDKTEANQLAKALADVNVHYQKTIDPKVVAWMGVIAVAGQVYGPRVLAYRVRMATEKTSKPPQQAPAGMPTKPAQRPASVVQMSAISDPDFVSPVQ
jgi:Ni,Fe-hydrogenase III small subunit